MALSVGPFLSRWRARLTLWPTSPFGASPHRDDHGRYQQHTRQDHELLDRHGERSISFQATSKEYRFRLAANRGSFAVLTRCGQRKTRRFAGNAVLGRLGIG
jgi:hypothetical protein